MKTTKFLLLSLFPLMLVQATVAQQQYTALHYGIPGTQYLYNSLYGYNQDSMLIQSGPDQIWDLSHTNVLTHLSKIVNKDEALNYFTYLGICSFGGTSVSDCGNIWNNTDHAWVNIDTLTLFEFSLTNSQRFQKNTGAYLLENFLGFKADIGSGLTSAVVVYSNPDTILHFPVSYGDHFTSAMQWQVDLNPLGQDVQYHSHQSRSTSIDAWGDLITPIQTFENTVRMRSEILRIDTLFTDEDTMPVKVLQVEYMWFDTSYKLPVMIALGLISDTSEVLTSIQYLWDKTCAVPTWEASVSSDTYTIDSSGSVTVEFNIENGNADEYSWDWGDGEVSTTTGSTTHTYTEPGAYEVTLFACMTNCLPLNSCSFTILDFIILSDQTISGEEGGIKIYPNPVGSQLNLFVPAEIGSAHFNIIDMNGKQLLSGDVGTGVNKVGSSRLGDGIYSMLIRPDHPTGNNYVVRFVVAR